MGATLRLNSKGGARWHPYHTSRITTQHSAPTLSTTGLDTPLSTHSQTVDSFQHQPPRQLTAQYLLYHKERIDARRIQKEKFDSALKEFCVKRLSDIWKETSYVKNSVYSRSTYRAPYSTSSFKDEEPAQVKLGSYLSPPLSPSPFAFQAHAGLIPTRGMSLKPFVFDVLRRSKTLWPALQVALCYLDTVRDKVTEAMAEAERGQGLAAAEADLESLFNFGNTNEPTTDSKPATGNATPCHPVTQTVSPPASEDGYATGCTQSGPATTDPSAQEPPRRVRRRKVPTVPPAPLPPRPSPLLCARRMFIAALILACKFTQDRVYSNRAWARICGLDAREVSRCERALGEALQWRLWVGKGVTDERAAFVRQFMQTEEGAPSLRPETTQTSIKKSPSADCALLTPQSSSGSPFTSPPEAVTPAPLTKSMSLPSEFFYSQATPTQTFSRDFSTALKKTSSWCHADAPAYNASQLTMTPANADLDAMDYEQGITAAHNANSLGRGVYFSPYGSTPSLTYDTPSAASITSSSDEYSFIPTGAVSSPTSFSQCTPSAKQEENDFSMPTPIKGVSMHTMHRQSGVERTFEVKLCDYDIVSSQPDASCVRKEY